ncbi:helix-turn-helix transcriptional regulator [Lactococcus garvieae]|uniref:DNA-binding transcriptional regulator, XRE-family HTH domain n=1 Tax=Lactococcus garvieae TaxID=1363 RepID=A0A1I4ILN0_9LACT|nr:helix-turn-helix transcriptional regulator [Lactococcus garvieae]SFL54923.1 DNA-binding transcriptional regulator, XRE-family HTH domain [Lactococcus garvieae]
MNIELRNARKKAGFTQKELAEKIGVSEHGYQNYETERRLPNVKIAIKIADELNVKDLRKIF